MAKPTVLHLGDAIKYNHDFYNNDFLARFKVVRNDAPDRPSFIQALKEKRFVAPWQSMLQSYTPMLSL